MSFVVSSASRRPRGLGTTPFMSAFTARAGEAIGTAMAARRATGLVDMRAQASEAGLTTAADVPEIDTSPREIDLPPEEEADLNCECLVKRGGEALVNLGMDASDVAASYTDDVAACEEDPYAFFAATAGFFPDGAPPSCAWYELPTKRNIAIGVGVAVALAGGVALYMRRRR